MKKLVLLVCVLLVVGFAQAVNLRYMGSGDYMDGSKWTADNSTPYGLPQPGDTIRANWGGGTISLNNPAPNTITAFQLGVDESGTLAVNAGGALTATGNSKIGNNGACTGTMTIAADGTVTNNGWLMVAGNSTVTGVLDVSGTLNANGHLWSATGAGSTATINIWDGGVINVGGMIGLGTVNASTAGGGNASLSVNDGGLLALSNIHGAGTSVFPGSMFYLNDSGMITLPSDFTGVMNNLYIPTYVTGNGVLGNAIATYDSEADMTYVVVPEPVTMSLLGLGALALLRKKK